MPDGMKGARILAVLALIAAGPSNCLWAAEGEAEAEPGKVSFHRDVRPLLERHCQGCHQPAKPLGGLVLTGFDPLLKGGESGTAGVVPGKPDESEIYIQIVSQGGDPPAMPKDREPLTSDEVAKIRQWIEEGAVNDTPASDRAAIDMEHPPTYLQPPVVTSLDYSPDGKLLAVSGFHEVLLYNTSDGTLVARLVGQSQRIEAAKFSADGKRLAVSGGSPARFGEVQIWNVEDHELELSVPITFDTIYGVSWSGDGSKIAFGCADNTVRVIDANSGEELIKQGAHSDWVLDTVFSKDSSHLISVSRDRSTKLTEIATGRFVDNITSITPGALKGGLIAVDSHPSEDQCVVGGADGTPKLYKIYRDQARKIGDDYNLIRAFEPLPGRIFDLEISRDGTQAVIGSSHGREGEARVYNLADGKLVCRLEGIGGSVYSVSFSPDAKHVVSAGREGIVRINDAATGKLVQEFVAVPISEPLANTN